jgi:hypothetical protein
MPRTFCGLGRRFPGFDTFFYGAILPFPLAPLPRFPITLPCLLVAAGAEVAFMVALCPTPVLAMRPSPVLALPWYPDTTLPPSPLDTTPLSPPPPPSLVLAPVPVCVRRGRRPAVRLPQRASSRLAARDAGIFIDSTARAVGRKALRESLASCSDDLKQQVRTRRILKRKNPLVALDLSRLAKAAGLAYSDRRAVAVAAATGGFP